MAVGKGLAGPTIPFAPPEKLFAKLPLNVEFSLARETPISMPAKYCVYKEPPVAWKRKSNWLVVVPALVL